METKELLQNISNNLGINELTGLQKEMLSLSATHNNIVVTAPTGSGKTLGFVLNVLSAMHAPDKTLQAVIIVPSRELAVQIGDVVRRVSSGYYKVCLCYGGHTFQDEERSISTGTDIIISTPGRLLDHLNRKSIDVRNTRYLVLDEYDKSLELGFRGEMDRIVKYMGPLQRIVMTSATHIAEWPEWLKCSKLIELTESKEEGKKEANDSIKIVRVTSYLRDKLPVLIQMLYDIQPARVIIFVNHRESADRVYNSLKQLEFPVGVYHGGLEQLERENSLEMFINGTTPVLVATDLGSRGLDIDGLDNVIHYHMPSTEQAWIHRNGRTGRMGSNGTVYAIIGEEESVPEFMNLDHEWNPSDSEGKEIMRSDVSTLWFGAGKKEKISRGDIVGFLIQAAGLPKESIGRISLRDHSSLVAVKTENAQQAVTSSKTNKVKGKRVRISIL